jgi:hypothetical protein
MDKAFERIECDNRVKEIGFPYAADPLRRANEKSSALRRRHDYPDRTFENRASSPCLHPRHENADFLLAFSHPADKTLLSFIRVSG